MTILMHPQKELMSFFEYTRWQTNVWMRTYELSFSECKYDEKSLFAKFEMGGLKIVGSFKKYFSASLNGEF